MPNLDMYSGAWTTTQARHLLRRATFGPSRGMVNTSVELGLSQTLNQLFTKQTLPDLPLKYHPDDEGAHALPDPDVNYGEPWFDAPLYPNVATNLLKNRILRARRKSLRAWTFLQMHYSGISLQEKMTLFWHNHFVAGNMIFAQREYLYQKIFRSQALGNFKQITKDITIDTGMLRYLSGDINTADAPNENYSRELLELFTIGKGEMVAPGDYTNYTETDVKELARALTGWTVSPVRMDHNALYATFNKRRHDSKVKQLSHRFNNAVIKNNDSNEYKDVVNIIFQQNECSRFIMRKLYRWFVSSEITGDIETNIIEPLAKIIRDNNYEIAPALRVLFASDHFFETTACMIKSPIDLVMSVSRGLGISPPQTSVHDEYSYAYILNIMCVEMEQAMFEHPNVAGWKAYYQEPLFYKTWINNLLLPKRMNLLNAMVYGGRYTIEDEVYTVADLIPVVEIAESIAGAENPNILVNELAAAMFNYPLAENQTATLVNILNGNETMADEWEEQFIEYLENRTDEGIRLGVQTKLRQLFSTMVQMSEFQIM